MSGFYFLWQMLVGKVGVVRDGSMLRLWLVRLAIFLSRFDVLPFVLSESQLLQPYGDSISRGTHAFEIKRCRANLDIYMYVQYSMVSRMIFMAIG